MSSSLFYHLANTDVSWLCAYPECNKPNFSSILFNPPVINSDDNRFSLLEESMRSADPDNPFSPLSPTSSHASSFSSPGSPQAASSPQMNNRGCQRNVAKSNFKTAEINFRSIKNKVAELHTFLDNADPDIVIGTES